MIGKHQNWPDSLLLWLQLLFQIVHVLSGIMHISGIMNFEIGVIFETVANRTINGEPRLPMLSHRDAEILGAVVPGLTLLQLAVHRCLIKVHDRNSLFDVIIELLGELYSFSLQ